MYVDVDFTFKTGAVDTQQRIENKDCEKSFNRRGETLSVPTLRLMVSFTVRSLQDRTSLRMGSLAIS